ncbi:MAG: two-component system phosphate regulon sensor histidine kinase PhoR [Chlamydiales bacterium]|jgi:two-component system phosphate regulon sensor histidine kinase PhoR
MRTLGFFWKVFGGSVAVVLITAIGVYTAALPAIERSLEQEAEQRVQHEAIWSTELCKEAFNPDSETFRTDGFSSIMAAYGGSRFTLVLPDGGVYFDSDQDPGEMDNHGSRAEIRTPGTAVTRFSRTLQENMTYFALPIVIDGVLRGHSRVSVPVEDRETRLVPLRDAIRDGALLATLISLLLAGYFARRVTRPLSEIADLVTEIGAHQTTRRLGVHRMDEVGRLGSAVNSMADELQGKTARVERDRAERDAIFSALAAGLLAVDVERNVLFINSQGRALLGGLEGRLKGKPVWELTRSSALIEVVDRCLSGATRVSGEAHFEGRDGERAIEVTAVPMVGETGADRGCVLELRDVSELRRLEAVRRDFVSNVSHELKTPLTAMRGYVEAVLDDDGMPEATRRSFLEKAHLNTERLAAIVSDLLSLSRLESDGHELIFETVDCAEQARSALDEMRGLADLRGVGLVLEAPEEALLVNADVPAFGTALLNLISNAIQYSPADSDVRVVVGCDADQARIDVIDEGPGIPLYEQERIFERFYRLDKARSRKLGGTGLGLAIARHVMSAHGGRVEVQSELGQGSRFSLLLARI